MTIVGVLGAIVILHFDRDTYGVMEILRRVVSVEAINISRLLSPVSG